MNTTPTMNRKHMQMQRSPGLKPRLMALAIAAALSASGPVFALPSGGQVVAGAATFVREGNALRVANTPGAIINWASFSVGALESVRFDQQSALSAVLNRVTGSEASALYGQLTSNGRVWLINPNGILFGAGARIDLPSFVASTLDVSNADFAAGRMNLTAGANAGGIRNEGAIQTTGNLYLVAPDIENSGVIHASTGEVLLAAGREVRLVDGAHPDIQVVVSAPTDRAVNLGTIAGRSVGLMGALIEQRGTVQATAVEVDDHGRIVFRGGQTTLAAGSTTTASGATGGSVSIDSTGDTLVEGDIAASGTAGKGGRIEVLGNRVAVFGEASLAATGATGGGTILVGGDYQGRNPDIHNSTITFVGANATLDASATTEGDGGTIIAWGNDTTRAFGSFKATGGSASGNGGFVETSAHHLDVAGIRVDTSAAHGATGSWLLDPDYITVSSYGGVAALTDVDQFSDPGGTVTIAPSTIDAASSNVTLQALYDIVFSDAVSIAASGVGLTALAGGTIIVNAPVSTNGGVIFLSAGDVAAFDAGSTATPGPVVVNAALSGSLVSLVGSSIGVNQSITATSDVLLTATTGSITQSANGGITGVHLNVNSHDTIDLTLASNSVAYVTGSVSYGGQSFLLWNHAPSLTVGPVTVASGNIEIKSFGGPLTQTGNVIVSGAGNINIEADGNIVMNSGTMTKTPSGDIEYNSIGSTGSITLAKVESTAGHVDVFAYGGIADGNGSATNVVANSATLVSDIGSGSAGVPAIDADVSIGNMFEAYVSGTYGSVDIRSPGGLNIGTIESYGTESDIMVKVAGALAVAPGGYIYGNGHTCLQSTSSYLHIGDGAYVYGDLITLEAALNVVIQGGQVWADTDVEITAGLDIVIQGTSGNEAIVAGENEVFLTATSGVITLESYSGYGGAAIVAAEALDTIYVNAPGQTTVAYVIDGVEGGSAASSLVTTSSFNPGTGFFISCACYGGAAVIGSNMFVNFGAPPVYTVDTFLLAGLASHVFGETPTAEFGYSLSPSPGGDTIGGSAVFTAVDALTPAGTFTVQYVGGLTSSLGGVFNPGAGVLYTVEPAVVDLIVSLTGTVSKVYDGNTTAVLDPSNFLLTGLRNGDAIVVTQTVGHYATKNVGSGIQVVATLAPEHFAPQGSTLLSNYILPSQASGVVGTITRLDTATWIGGVSNNWLDPANWANGALPDSGDNVGAVSIPPGATVVFNGLESGLPLTIEGISGAGTLSMAGGHLITPLIATGGYVQTGGIVEVGLMDIGQSFLKGPDSGSLIADLIKIHQASGDLVFYNDHPVILGLVKADAGNILIDAVGGIHGKDHVTASGDVKFVAHSPLLMDGDITAGGDIQLTAGGTEGSGDLLTLNGSLTSTGDGSINLTAADGITQNADITTHGGTVTSEVLGGNLVMAAGTATTTYGGPINYAASGGLQLGTLDALANGNLNVAAGGSITSAPGHVGPNLAGGIATLHAGGDAILSSNVFAIGGSVGGALSISNNGTVISNLGGDPSLAPGNGTQEQIEQAEHDVIEGSNVGSTKPDDLTGKDDDEDEDKDKTEGQGQGSQAANAAGKKKVGYCN